MKNIFLALAMVLLLAIPVSAGDTTYWQPEQTSGYYEEVKCEICGKLMRRWVPTPAESRWGNITLTSGSLTLDSDDGWITVKVSDLSEPLEKASTLQWNTEIYLCKQCLNKYGKALQEKLATTYDIWLREAKIATKDRRTQMQNAAKEYRVQALRKELDDFKKQVKEKLNQIQKLEEITE